MVEGRAVITGTPRPRNCVKHFLMVNTRPVSADFLWRVVTLAAAPQAVGEGRAWSRETTKEWQLDHMTDVVAQLVSELVTNSVEHADTSCVRVLLMLAAGILRLDVTDDDVVSLPIRAQAGADDVAGRGLEIVEALSDRWGVHISATAKSVWCELVSWPG